MKAVEVPITQAMVAKTHPPRYMMHKFWARKPHNVIAAYIQHFTQPGDIVLDPFCGSGVTVSEALHSQRRAVGVDLNPVAGFISRMTCLPADLQEFGDAAAAVNNALVDVSKELYSTTCPGCRQVAEATYYVWVSEATCQRCLQAWPLDDAIRRGGYFYCRQCGHRLTREDTSRERLVKVLVSCKCNGSARLKQKEPDDEDFQRAASADGLTRIRPEFRTALTVNTRHDVFAGMTVGSLFTARARAVLSALRNLIDEVSASALTKEFLLLAFTASLPQSSRLHSIDFRPRRTYRSRGWTLPSYWVASGHFEHNARLGFAERCQKVRRGKADSNEYIPADVALEWGGFEELSKHRRGFVTRVMSAADLSDLMPDGSVEYVFSDPPYGDSITYLELSEIWNAWLPSWGAEDYEKEVVISDAEGRHKTLERYRGQLGECFEAIHRVLRPGGWMSLTFHNRNIAVWNALLNAAVDAHFDFVNDIYQLPATASAKSSLQPSGSMTGDVVLNFRKPAGVPSRLRAGSVDVERLILDESRQIIAERGGLATEDQLMRGVVHVLLRNGVVDQSPENVRTILARYLEPTERGWRLRADSAGETLLDFVPLEKRILWLIESVLSRGPVTLDQILQRIFTTLKNGRTPEAKEISQLLDSVAVEMGGGNWRRRTAQDGAIQLALGEIAGEAEDTEEQEAAATHDQFVRMLAELGMMNGYAAWIGRSEQRGNRRLAELSFPRLVIPGLEASAISDNRIDEIDVVWLRDGAVPVGLFEVEHTTRAMTCIPRLGNLTRLLPHLALDVFLVARDGLEEHLRRQLSTPSAKAILGGHRSRWYFLPYTEVLRLYETAKEGVVRIGEEQVRAAARSID